MPTTKPMPFLVAETTATGSPSLAGRRRLDDDIDHAAALADEIGGRVFAIEPVEPNPVAPRPAITHVSLQGLAAVPVVVATDPEPISVAMCPCGYRTELFDGASDDERHEFDEAWADHIAWCDADEEQAA